MTDIRTSFSYDPAQQGYDTNTWTTIAGAPAVAADRLSVDTGSGRGLAIHYVDCVKGEIKFNVKIPVAPGVDANRFFGVSNGLATKYICFAINNDLTCQTRNVLPDGSVVESESSAIQWNSDWTNAADGIEFGIRWEAGTAKFFIDGTQVYAISDASIPYGPLSLYIADESGSPMTFGTIEVLGTNSYTEVPKTSDATSYAQGQVIMSQAVTVTDVPSFMFVNYVLPNNYGVPFETVVVSENIAFFNSHRNIDVNENITVAEVNS